MRIRILRVAIPLAIVVVFFVAFLCNLGTGSLSAFGWREISLLCPLGALESMLAGKTFVPRALISLVVVVVVVVLTGRAFCSWVCPVPLVSRLRNLLKPSSRKKSDSTDAADGAILESDVSEKVEATHASNGAILESDISESSGEALAGGASDDMLATGMTQAAGEASEADVAREMSVSGVACGTSASGEACVTSQSGMVPDAETRRIPRVDSRHVVLIAALLSATIFGFPVFCLICPVGLVFATVLLLINLFGNGDVTWAVVAVPALLFIEVVFFRSWCSKICPMSAFLSLIAKTNRTFLPFIDKSTCLEASKNASCGRCTKACGSGINLRDGSLGASRSECSRCLECFEACPAHAIHIVPFLKNGNLSKSPDEHPDESSDDVS